MSNYTCHCLFCHIKLLKQGGEHEFYIVKAHISQIRALSCRRYLYITQVKLQPLQIVHINETDRVVPAEISLGLRLLLELLVTVWTLLCC